MFFLDLQSRTPIYEQIKNNILKMIALNVLKPNEQLPSVRSVARDLGINPNTVQKAYQELESQGVLYSVAGKGSFICETSAINDGHRQQILETLKKGILDAKAFGVAKQEILMITDTVYKE